MSPYFILFSIISFVSLLDLFRVKKQTKKLIVLFLVLILTTFAALRNNVGFQDYDIYVESYQDIANNGLDSSKYYSSISIFEPGFKCLYYLSSIVSNNPVFVLFVVAFIAVTINLLSYYRYSSFCLIAILLYFVHTYTLREMIQIRAGLAAAICLFSIRYIETKQIKKFLLTIILASSFHLASCAFIGVYWAYHRNWTKKKWLIIIFISLIIGLFMPLGKFMYNIPMGFIEDRVATYTWMIGTSTKGILNITIIKQFAICLLSIAFWDRLMYKVPHFYIYFICMAISLCWLLLWNDFPIISNRVATFFSITEVLIVPSFLYLLKPNSRFIGVGIIIIYALLTLWLNIYIGNIILYNSSYTFPEIL